MLLCVSLVWPTKFENTLSFVQNWFDVWKFTENVRNFNFGNFGLKFLFLKIKSSHTHAFCSSISMVWVVPKCFFSKTMFFLKFSEPLLVLIDPFYFSINRIFLKNVLTSLCLFQSIETIFRSIETCKSGSLKTHIWLVQITFSNFFLSLRLGKAPLRIFVVFLHFSCKESLSLSWYVHITLSFSFIFCFTCIEGLFLDLAIFWGFWWFKPYFVKLIIGFLF